MNNIQALGLRTSRLGRTNQRGQLKAAYERVKPDSAPGVDGQNWADYGKDLEKNLLSLLNRFADDFILGFEHKEDAEKVYRVLFQRFEKYGLSLHAEKTRKGCPGHE